MTVISVIVGSTREGQSVGQPSHRGSAGQRRQIHFSRHTHLPAYLSLARLRAARTGDGVSAKHLQMILEFLGSDWESRH